MAFCKGIPSGKQEFVSLCKGQTARKNISPHPGSCINLKPHTSFPMCCVEVVKELKMAFTQRTVWRDLLGLAIRIRES